MTPRDLTWMHLSKTAIATAEQPMYRQSAPNGVKNHKKGVPSPFGGLSGNGASFSSEKRSFKHQRNATVSCSTPLKVGSSSGGKSRGETPSGAQYQNILCSIFFCAKQGRRECNWRAFRDAAVQKKTGPCDRGIEVFPVSLRIWMSMENLIRRSARYFFVCDLLK